MNSREGLSLEKIAEITGGILIGTSDVKIKNAGTLEKAEEGYITFFANPKYKKWVESTKASCILVPANINMQYHIPVIKVENPDKAFTLVLNALYGSRKHPVLGVSDTAKISSDAKISKGVRIGDFTVIEPQTIIGENTIIYPNVYIGVGVEIGSDCVIYPGVVILENVSIGDRVIINSSSVIGSDGFGYITEGGQHSKIPQVGSVVVGSDVEVGTSVCIDRGTPGNTIIGQGTKIDNLVHIAHNVRIGKMCLICGQVGIAGSTIVEDGVFMAGQAGIVGHVTVGSFAKIGAQAGVTRDIPKGQLVSGYPAMEHSYARKINVFTRKLPKLFKEFEKLRKRIDQQ